MYALALYISLPIVGYFCMTAGMFGFLKGQPFGLTWGEATEEQRRLLTLREINDKETDRIFLAVFWPATALAMVIVLLWRLASKIGFAIAKGPSKTKLPKAEVIKK